MKKTDKKLYFFALVLLGLVSCVDLTLESTRPNTNYPSEVVMTGLLTTAYNTMMTNTMYGDYIWGSLGGCDTDESFYKTASISDLTTLGNHNIQTTDTPVKNFYAQFYQGIESCNLVLEMSQSIVMDATTKNHIIGQARTLRAFYFYLLASNFGPVALKTISINKMTSFEMKRDSVKKVCQFALDEMRASIPLLKPISKVGFTAEISQSAAEALSYRIALYMASHPNIQDVAKYDSVAVWGKNFIASGVHSLNSAGYKPATTNNATWNETTSAYARLFVLNMENKTTITGNPEGILDAVFFLKSITSGTYANLGYPAIKQQRMGAICGVDCPVVATVNNPIGYCASSYLPQPTLFNKYESGDLRRSWNITTYCYKEASVTRYPYFFLDYAGATTSSAGTTLANMGTPTRKAVLTPTIINGVLSTDPTTMMIDDGGAGYTDGTYFVPADGYLPGLTTSALALTKTVTGIAHNATDVTKAAASPYTATTYPAGTQRVQVQVVGGAITSILSIATQGSGLKSGYVNVNLRGIGKWRREYEINLTPERTKDYTSSNFPIIRYADVLLMVAEASLFNTTTKGGATLTDGQEYLNMVRRRGYGLDPAVVSPSVDRVLTLDMIKDERSRELCFEGLRHTDLIRWGEDTYRKAMNQVNTDVDKSGAGLVAGKYAINLLMSNYQKYTLLPIPSTELTATPNSFTQNPGW